MAVSFGMLGILWMLDVCFIVNFCVVRALRRWTDRHTPNISTLSERSSKASIDVESDNDKKKKHGGQDWANSMSVAAEVELDKTWAWCCGRVRLSPLVTKQFPGWRPIPYYSGILTTCVFVLIGIILLTPNLILNQIGISIGGGSLNPDLCVTDDHDAGVADLRAQLVEKTNLELAKKQHRLMVDFHEALVKDTSLYGVGNFKCPTVTTGDGKTITGYKTDWNDPSKGDFFPGYCEEALEAAIEAAKNRECVEEVCDCPVMPDTALFKAFGVADKKFCGKVCLKSPYACPAHTADEERELQDYRYQQHLAAENRREELDQGSVSATIVNTAQTETLETIDRILFQVDVASYIYVGYSLIALFFPSPLTLFRPPIWVLIKKYLFGVERLYFILFVVAFWWGVEYFQRIWYSPDLRLFLNNLRIGDPCFVDGSYLVDRRRVYEDVCTELLPLEPEWSVSFGTVKDVLNEVQAFRDSCNCAFPNNYLSRVASHNVLGINDAEEIGFTTKLDLCETQGSGNDSCIYHAPDEFARFFGDTTICTDGAAARELVYEAPEADASWWELWITSGLLATVVVKVAVANYGLSLMTLADPFVICAGEFLWTPANFWVSRMTEQEKVDLDTMNMLDPESLEQWMQTKLKAIFQICLSQTVFWGIIVHLSMLNLFATAYDEMGSSSEVGQEMQQTDFKVLTGCSLVAAAVLVLGYYVCYRLRPTPHDSITEEKRLDEDVHSQSRLLSSEDDYSDRSPGVLEQTDLFESMYDTDEDGDQSSGPHALEDGAAEIPLIQEELEDTLRLIEEKQLAEQKQKEAELEWTLKRIEQQKERERQLELMKQDPPEATQDLPPEPEQEPEQQATAPIDTSVFTDPASTITSFISSLFPEGQPEPVQNGCGGKPVEPDSGNSHFRPEDLSLLDSTSSEDNETENGDSLQNETSEDMDKGGPALSPIRKAPVFDALEGRTNRYVDNRVVYE